MPPGSQPMGGPRPGMPGPGMPGGPRPGMMPPGTQPMARPGMPGMPGAGPPGSQPMARPGMPGGPPGGFGGPPGAGGAPGGMMMPGAGPPSGPPTAAPPMGGPMVPQPGPPRGAMAPPAMGGVPGAPPGAGPPAMGTGAGAYGAFGVDPAHQEQLLSQFGSLALGSAVPGQSGGIEPEEFPRPIGAEGLAALEAPEPTNPANCPSRFVRMTCNAVPNGQQLRQRWKLPLGCVVQPLADRNVPVVDLGSAGIVRCRTCRTYINPFVQWSDGGRRWRCNVCALLNEVPVEYYCSLDENGQRRDRHERPELSQGCVEFVAPVEYSTRPPMPPSYFFVIDVSAQAVQSGMLATVCRTIRACLDRLPGDDRTKIGFLTFDRSLHFYNLRAASGTPHMLVVPETDDPFVPLPDDLLANLSECRPQVEALLDSLPGAFASNDAGDSATGPALQAAFLCISAWGGKMMLFQAATPSLGVGRVKNRDNPTLYGTDREHTMRNPEDPFWKKFAGECVGAQITVDVFAFGKVYMDLASLATLPKHTSGNLCYYPGYTASQQAAKLEAELTRNLTRETAWEAVMRLRCSKGLVISSFHGHFFIRSRDLLAIPCVDEDKSFAADISLEDQMLTNSIAYVQGALLYTASCGERRIRVMTLQVPVTNDLGELYNAADCAATSAFLAKLAVEKSYSSRLQEAREFLNFRMTQALQEYRSLNSLAARYVANRLIYPKNLSLLPLFALAASKFGALRGSRKDVAPDERVSMGFDVMSQNVDMVMRLCYPRLYVVSDPGGDWGSVGRDGATVMPPQLPLTLEKLDLKGAYLLDTGRIFVLLLGRAIAPEFIKQVFGLSQQASQQELQAAKIEPARDAPMSKRLNSVIGQLRRGNPSHPLCFVVKQGDPQEQYVLPYFVEDRGPGLQSYTEHLCFLHRAVMSKGG